MNINPAMSNLASLMASQSSMDMGMGNSAAALSNAFGIGPMGALNAAANQFANTGNAGNLAAALQNSGVNMAGLQGNQGGAANALMMGGGGASMANAAGMSGANIGSASGVQAQPSPFQT